MNLPKTLEEAIEVIHCLRKAVRYAEEEAQKLTSEVESLSKTIEFLEDRLEFADEVLAGIQESAREFVNNKVMTSY